MTPKRGHQVVQRNTQNGHPSLLYLQCGMTAIVSNLSL